MNRLHRQTIIKGKYLNIKDTLREIEQTTSLEFFECSCEFWSDLLAKISRKKVPLFRLCLDMCFIEDVMLEDVVEMPSLEFLSLSMYLSIPELNFL
jgi:hypothetical protein